MVQDRGILTMADRQKVVYGVSNGAIIDDLEQPRTQFSRSRYNLTINGKWLPHYLVCR